MSRRPCGTWTTVELDAQRSTIEESEANLRNRITKNGGEAFKPELPGSDLVRSTDNVRKGLAAQRLPWRARPWFALVIGATYTLGMWALTSWSSNTPSTEETTNEQPAPQLHL